jgi:DNA-binding transcriptional LysR family regulator
VLGRALFERRADGYALTVEGKAVLDEASAMDEAALSVLRRLDAGTELSGLVRLTAGRVLAESFLIDRLSGFHERYPAIDIELIGEARVVSLARREADIALRFGSPRDSELLTRRLGRIGFGLYASPTYRHRLDRRETPSFIGFDTMRVILLPRPNGLLANLATSGLLFEATRKHRKPLQHAVATVSRSFLDIWPPMTAG